MDFNRSCSICTLGKKTCCTLYSLQINRVLQLWRQASGLIIHDTWTFCAPMLNAHTHAPKHSYVVPYNKHTFLKINITASKFVFLFWVCVIYIVEQTSKYRQFMHTTDLVLLMLKNSMIKAQKYLENLWQIKVIALWVWNFRTLKNKYDLTLCQSCLHTASKIFIQHNFF